MNKREAKKLAYYYAEHCIVMATDVPTDMGPWHPYIFDNDADESRFKLAMDEVRAELDKKAGYLGPNLAIRLLT